MSKTSRAFVPILFSAFLLAACASSQPQTPYPVNIKQAVTDRIAAGVDYMRQGNPKEARRHFNRALQLDPHSAAANNAMALLYAYEQDPQDEEKYYKRALDDDPHFAPALNNYGAFLYTQGRYKEAVEKFKRAVDDPNYDERASALSNLGQCYEALGELDKARDTFQRVLRINPGMLTASRELARIYYKQKHYDLAWNYYQQYQSRTKKPGPDGLWLGIRIAAQLNKQDDQSSYELALQNLYPGSNEYRLWQKWKKSQETR